MDAASVGFGIAFLAGVVSFLSPCILPIVPGYVGFITGLSLDELQEGTAPGAQRRVAAHAALFVLGFTVVFVALGASATAVGSLLRDALPALQRAGGVVILGFGLFMLGLLRLPGLMRERRVQSGSRPAGMVGSVMAGIGFGAGWTPCIGPVLASLLLYAGMEETMMRGMALLGIYASGLGIPFFVSALGLNFFLAGMKRIRPWIVPAQRVAGGVLVVVGLLLVTGEFARMTEYLAQFSPAITLEP